MGQVRGPRFLGPAEVPVSDGPLPRLLRLLIVAIVAGLVLSAVTGVLASAAVLDADGGARDHLARREERAALHVVAGAAWVASLMLLFAYAGVTGRGHGVAGPSEARRQGAWLGLVAAFILAVGLTLGTTRGAAEHERWRAEARARPVTIETVDGVELRTRTGFLPSIGGDGPRRRDVAYWLHLIMGPGALAVSAGILARRFGQR
jgi:hypothetical protein